MEPLAKMTQEEFEALSPEEKMQLGVKDIAYMKNQLAMIHNYLGQLQQQYITLLNTENHEKPV